MTCHCDLETKEFVILKGENFPKIIIKRLNRSDKMCPRGIHSFCQRKFSNNTIFQQKKNYQNVQRFFDIIFLSNSHDIF